MTEEKPKKNGGTKDKEVWKNASILTGEDSISENNSGGGTLNRLIEINVDDLSKIGNLYEDCAYASSIAKENYGYAGRIFIEYVQKMGKEAIYNIYRKKLDEIKALNITADKQAVSMANIMAADEIVNMFMFDEPKITANDIKDLLFSKEEIDISERCYEYVMGEIAIHNSFFVDMETYNPNYGFDKNKMREFWGSVEKNQVTILKTKFEKILKDGGFNYKKTTKDWANCGYLIKNSQGKNVHQTTTAKMKGTYVKIKIIDKEKEELEAEMKKQEEIEQKQKELQRQKNVTNNLNNMLGKDNEYQDYFMEVGENNGNTNC